jgi:hypothetical protein
MVDETKLVILEKGSTRVIPALLLWRFVGW